MSDTELKQEPDRSAVTAQVLDFDRLAQDLIDTLPTGIPGLFNPWRDLCPEDLPGNTPAAKQGRLAAHLNCVPEFILCGEAPGYQGCRHSGVAFTSEKMLLAGAIPRVDTPNGRLTTRHIPFSEPSATIVWKALHRLGIAERTILWNAVQMHPHKPDNLRSNRTPTPAEIALGEPAVRLLVAAYPNAKIVAVGKKAEGLLKDMGVSVTASVRHPANGGATEFTEGLSALVKGNAQHA